MLYIVTHVMHFWKEVTVSVLVDRFFKFHFNLFLSILSQLMTGYHKFQKQFLIFRNSCQDCFWYILYFHLSFSKEKKRRILKKNPLGNYRVMVRLNPYHKHAVKLAKHTDLIRRRKRVELQNKKRGVRIPSYFGSLYLLLIDYLVFIYSYFKEHTVSMVDRLFYSLS